MNEEEAREIIEDFLLELEVLSQEFGKEATAKALMTVEPGVLDVSSAPGTALNEAAPAAAGAALGLSRVATAAGRSGRVAKLASATKNRIKQLLGLGGQAAVAGGGMLYTGAALMARSVIDQDVNIADQEIDVKVVNPSLEKLINSTNTLLQNIVDTLHISRKENDDNLDFLSATVSGDSLASVKGAQATASPTSAGIEPDIERSQSPTKSKLEPKPKSKKKEKESETKK